MMIDRRTFMKIGVAAAATATFSSKAIAKQSPKKTSEVKGCNYRLPAFKKGSRLLFQGDSITDMNRGRNPKDRNHYLGHSYVFLIAARLGLDMPEAQLDFYNRGVSANRVSHLKKRWQKDAIAIRPDLLSILVGVNDADSINAKPNLLKKWEEDYRFILDASRKANPKLRLVLLDPFILPRNPVIGIIQKQGKIVAQLAKEYNAVHIETQDIFEAAMKTTSPRYWL